MAKSVLPTRVSAVPRNSDADDSRVRRALHSRPDRPRDALNLDERLDA
jgi:hypothetical protein